MSAGITRAFGWKPIGKFVGTNVTNLTIDPLPCTFNRKVMMVYDVGFATPGNLLLTVNGDLTSHWYTIHTSGISSGVIVHTSDAQINTSVICLSLNSISCAGSAIIKKINYNIHLTNSCFGYKTSPTNDCYNYTTGGVYTAGVPTKFKFFHDTVLTFTSHIEFFESVL